MNNQTKSNHAIKIGIDDFLGDIFVLNIKGFKSLWALITKPARYFESALSPDWDNRYTPSIRLWFSALAVLFFFKFIWGSNDAAMLQALEFHIQSSNIQLPENVTLEEAVQTYSRWWFAYIPLLTAIMVLLLGIIWPFGKDAKSAGLKARYIFAVATPGAFLTIASTLLQSFLPYNFLYLAFFTGIFFIFCLDSLTAYRGAYRNESKRFIRSFLLAFALFATNFLANFFAQTLAMQTLAQTYAI